MFESTTFTVAVSVSVYFFPSSSYPSVCAVFVVVPSVFSVFIMLYVLVSPAFNVVRWYDVCSVVSFVYMLYSGSVPVFVIVIV